MAFSLEALYAFFSPSASRNSSPDGSPSLLSALFSSKSDPPNNNNKDNNNTTTTTTITKQADGDLPMPSPVESHASSAAPSERDYSPPPSPPNGRTSRPTPPLSSSPAPSAASMPPPQTHQRSDREDQRGQQQQLLTTPPTPPPPPRRSATEIVAPEPLSREFPLPEDEPSLDELLARKPGKWSLGHYVKHARVRRGLEEGDGGEELAQQRQRELEDAKKELLRAKEEMELLVKGRMGL